MKKCNDCDEPIIWCEIETRNGLKKIPVNPAPADDGDLVLLRTHPDLPMRAVRKSEIKTDFFQQKTFYKSHRDTCSAVDPADRKKYTRDESWVREPEGY